MSASAHENYFVEGTTWHIYQTAIQPYLGFPDHATDKVLVKKRTDETGNLNLYIAAQGEKGTRIKTDGDKVYFYTKPREIKTFDISTDFQVADNDN